MNFNYSEEQHLFQDSIGKYLADTYSFEQRQQRLEKNASFSADVWRDASELGWLAMPFPEDCGGYGGTAIELMLLFEEMGKKLVVEPFLDTLVLGGGLLRRLSSGRHDECLAKLIEGQVHCAVAHEEGDQAYAVDHVTAAASRSADGFILNGQKSVVYNLGAADFIVVSAMLDEEFSLFLVPAHTAGLVTQTYMTVDDGNAGELTLENVHVAEDALLGVGETAVEALERTIDEAILASSAEQVGIMRSLLDLTVDYTSQRKQFGVPISTFQVLQHRMANMFMALELTVSLMYATAIKMRDDSDDAAAYVAALKVKTDNCARDVAHGAFQLFGAMATTRECSVGHYLKRVATLRQRFGGTRFQLQRYVTSSILGDEPHH